MAAVIAQKYKCRISKDMVERAIKTSKFEFLYAVYAYDMEHTDLVKDDEPMTMNWLFKQIIEFCEERATMRVKEVAEWVLTKEENILLALLDND